MPSTVQLKPLTDALYLQGARDKNIISDKPLGKLLIQMGNLGSGKASRANLRLDPKGEQKLARLPEQAKQRKGVEGSAGRGNSRDKVQEEGEEGWPVRELKKLWRALAREGGTAASLAPWGAPGQVLSSEVVGSDLHFGKVA